MRPLIVDSSLRTRCQEVREYASRLQNWYHHGVVAWVPGDQEDYLIKTDTGYRVVFSITLIPGRPPFRHMTMSVNGPDYPNPAAVWMMAHLLGFTGGHPEGLGPSPDWGVALDEGEHCVVVQQVLEDWNPPGVAP